MVCPELSLCPIVQDGLLSQGNTDLIMRIFSKIPKVSPEGRRLQVGVAPVSCDSHVIVISLLQMIVCSATLHNVDVKKLAVS